MELLHINPSKPGSITLTPGYWCYVESIMHPETQEPIVCSGELVTVDSLNALQAAGADSVLLCGGA